MKYKLKKHIIFGLLSITTILFFGGCGFNWGWFSDKDGNNPIPSTPIALSSYNVKAGEEVVATLNFSAYTSRSHSDKIVLAVQVPKVWNGRDPGVIEVTLENTSTDKGVKKSMEMIPVGTQPNYASGISWEQALLNRFGDSDPNLLDDMQWIAFIEKETKTLNNDRWNYIAEIKIKTGPENVKTRIGFCIYDDVFGGRDWFYENENDNSLCYVFREDWAQCLTVSEGEGDVIDFCELHFNQQTPGMANQNDILTFRYIGDIATNDLMNADEIFINSVAITTTGRKIEMTEKSDNTKLIKESEWGLTYSKTFWPEEYYNLSAGETLTKIEYYFTNKNGDKYVSLYDDKNKDDSDKINSVPDKPLEPFVFNFKLD